MHKPSDETEQYDEPETIVQRHGGVELPFKHHDGGMASASEAIGLSSSPVVGDHSIKKSPNQVHTGNLYR